MGLAILPGRLEQEMKYTAEALCSPDPEAVLTADPSAALHKDWALSVPHKRKVTKENAEQILKEEIGHAFARILEHAGVFKQTEEGRAAFRRFIRHLGALPEKAPSHKGRGFFYPLLLAIRLNKNTTIAAPMIAGIMAKPAR